jgi:hypothetical protein
MPTPTIPAGNLFMNATLYTGNGTTQTITNGVAGKSFQPDLVWTKSRSAAYNNCLIDSIRGVSAAIFTDTTDLQLTAAGYYVTAFNSNGFSVGLGTGSNNNGDTYVGWNWKAGGSAVSNTSGSVTSTVSANTTSGFSIVKWTGNGGVVTIGHGLGVVPSFIFLKRVSGSGTSNWSVYHQSIGNTGGYNMNTQDAVVTNAGFWNNTSPTSSLITVGTYESNSGANFIAYCFSQIDGYSAFGSYTGNGLDDGPFIYTGFRPKWFYSKCISTGGENSMLYDTSMNPYNQAPEFLAPNLNSASNTAGGYYNDFLSNGIKIRHGATGNNSGRTYIYAAFAENPFKYANAR